MSDQSSSATAAMNALIPWRMRRDVTAQSAVANGESGWTLKDPLSLAYFRLCDAEYALLGWLDGRITYAGALANLRQRFPAEQWSLENLQAFLRQLVQSELVTGQVPGQGRQIARRQRSMRTRRRWGLLTNLLAFRWRGIDPEPLLSRCDGWTRWLFHPAVIAVCLALIGSALSLVIVRWESLMQRLPGAQSLLGLNNLLPLVLVFVGIKLLHELGHVLTCRHFGGECHELGILLLVFVPLFYGDVTDAWMVARRRHRVAISLAGIFVELVIASVATWLWWASVPGLLNSIFLNVMLVCSVNTFLINGNPLLRYDGYYALADALNMPNLSQQAAQAVSSWFDRLVLGVDFGDAARDHRRGWLISYGLASAVYRWFVLIAIVWFLHRLAGDSGLGIFATLLSVLIVGAAVAQPIVSFSQRVRSRWNNGGLRPGRMAGGFGILVAGLLAVLFIPLPHSVSAPFVLHPGDAHPIFASVAGRIESAVAPGTRVEVGGVLAELTNYELQQRHERQQAEVSQLSLRLKNLEAQRGTNEDLSLRLPAARDALASAQRRLEQLGLELTRLNITSPANGTVLPPPNVPAARADDLELPDWSGTPLDAINRGATLREQTLLCYVGDPAKQDALLLVDQSAIEFVRPGQTARVQFQSMPGEIRTGIVAEIASSRRETLPRELTVTHLVPARPSDTGPVPLEVSYEVRVRLTDSPPSEGGARGGKPGSSAPASLYSPGHARIACGRLSLAARCWRLLRQTFSARL